MIFSFFFLAFFCSYFYQGIRTDKNMLPAARVRLLFTRFLREFSGTTATEMNLGSNLHTHLLKDVDRENCSAERIVDTFASVSCLGLASQEEWIRFKRVLFANISHLSCSDICKGFIHLVKHDVCSHVECVSIQEKLVELDFSDKLSKHEQLSLLQSVAVVGSRISPRFLPPSLSIIEGLMKDSTTEHIPRMLYILGKLFSCSENDCQNVKLEYSLWLCILKRVQSLDTASLKINELVYILWSLTAFWPSLKTLEADMIRGIENVIMQEVMLRDLKEIIPKDLVLLFCGLCNVLSVLRVTSPCIPCQTDGVIVDVLNVSNDSSMISTNFFQRLLFLLDVVTSSIVRHIVSGKLQNNEKVIFLLEMLTKCGLTKILKNAQILFHLLLRAILYNGQDAWFCQKKDSRSYIKKNAEHTLVNWFLFDDRVDFLDLLTVRLGKSLPKFLSLRSFEGSSVRGIVAVLEGLAHGNISEKYKQIYLEGCKIKLPRVLCASAKKDFCCLTEAIIRLHINDHAVAYAIQSRSEELGLKMKLCGTDGTCTKEEQETLMKTFNAAVKSPGGDEKVMDVMTTNNNCKSDSVDFLQNLIIQRRLKSVNVAQCVEVVKKFSRSEPDIPANDFHGAVMASIFRRVEVQLPCQSLLLLILYAVKAGVDRAILVEAHSYVGSKLLSQNSEAANVRDIVTYFITAHELGVGTTIPHPHLIRILVRGGALESLSPQTASRLLGALCSLGVDNKRLLRRILSIIQPWISVSSLVVWDEKFWKSFFVLMHTLWMPSSFVVKKQLLVILRELSSFAIDQQKNLNTSAYSVHIATAMATLINGEIDSGNICKGDVSSQSISLFLSIVSLLLSEDGISLSLSRFSAILESEDKDCACLPGHKNIISLLIIAHTLHLLSQLEINAVKRISSFGVSLWRSCLKHLEKLCSNDSAGNDTLLTAMAFSIQFGASSQMVDRLMSSLISTDKDINMAIVTRIADGLVQTGKRRPVATQFVAHYIQKSSLDDIPVTALLSLFVFITRDAERVALGLARTEMLASLLWSSLSIKFNFLPYHRNFWSIIEFVPLESRPLLMQLVCNEELIENSSVMELFRSISLILTWKHAPESNTKVTEFLRKVKVSVEKRCCEKLCTDEVAAELLQTISSHV